MYDDVRVGLKKMRDAVPNLRAFKRASMIGVTLPTGDTLDTYLPTFLYIATVSLLDDALEEVISTHYPGTATSKLAYRIDFLGANGRLKDPARLHSIRQARNRYAHEAGEYASWQELDVLLSQLEDELKHLQVL